MIMGEIVMYSQKKRLSRERRTIEAMIEIYCGKNHALGDSLCPKCRELFSYAIERIDKCPFQEEKPTCAKCPVHCYKPMRREEVRQVMRYAGPRMTLHHPILAIMHYVDSLVYAPKSKKRVRELRVTKK